jgi:hypothetical protein
MRTVFGVWVKGPEGPALLAHLLAHLHNTLIKVLGATPCDSLEIIAITRESSQIR